MNRSQGQHDLGGQLQEFCCHSSCAREQAFGRDNLSADGGRLLDQLVALFQRAGVQLPEIIDAQGTLYGVAALPPVGRAVERARTSFVPALPALVCRTRRPPAV